MKFEPTVPFPAEDLGKCRGCDAAIGWIRREVDGEQKPHPVDPKGYHGEACGHGAPGAVRGFTLEGDVVSVRPFPGGQLFEPHGETVFTSHFATCPKADRFRRAAAGRR